MYHPGGATVGSVGAVTEMVPLPWAVMVRSTSRWEESKAWVVIPGRTMLTQRVAPAAGEAMVNACP
jgi:hypothetical protein